MKINHALIIYYVHNYQALRAVQKCMRYHKITFTSVRRAFVEHRHFRGKDLVITVGGDGTFLFAARHLKHTPILSITSDIHHNEGYFAQATKNNVVNRMHDILQDRHKILKLPRLKAAINGKTVLKPIVNELFIGSTRPYHTARYEIQIGRKKEYHKSSGVLVSTGAGSHAWSASAGGKLMSKVSKKMQYIVLEPYFGRLAKPSLVNGTVKFGEKIKIISHIHDGIAVSDSMGKEYSFKDKSTLEVSGDGIPLNYISFSLPEKNMNKK